MSIQFVSCNDESCPLNEGKNCRASWLMVDEDGKCAIRDQCHDEKSTIETYVDLKECRCESCNNWELDEASQIGQCGLREDLFFRLKKTLKDKKEVFLGPFCFSYEKQISEPGAFDKVVI